MNITKYIKSILLTSIYILISLLVSKPTMAAEANFTFYPETIDAVIGTNFKVSILLDTSGYAVGGAGAIIKYDPTTLKIIDIHNGDIFADYPISSFNEEAGIIKVSGIASSTENLYIGKGIFTTITLQSKQVGITNLNFDFTPGSTRDSNIAVTFGSGDVLQKVDTLTITTTGSSDSESISNNPLDNILSSVSNFSLKNEISKLTSSIKVAFASDKYASTRSGRTASEKLDPLNPIEKQSPITDPLDTQPTATIGNATPLNNFIIPALLILIIMTLLAIYYIYKKL